MTDGSTHPPRTALVTGANRGLGRATAAALAAEGVKVWLGVRDTAAGEDAARGIGRGARVVTLDLDRPETLAHLPEATGSVDILVNNAGLAHVAPMIEDPEGFGTQMRVMVHSPTNWSGFMYPEWPSVAGGASSTCPPCREASGLGCPARTPMASPRRRSMPSPLRCRGNFPRPPRATR